MRNIFLKGMDRCTSYSVTVKIFLISNSSRKQKLLHFLVKLLIFFALFYVNVSTARGAGISELENLIKKPSYRLWRQKSELSQIVTS